jgi:hypothetical protein
MALCLPQRLRAIERGLCLCAPDQKIPVALLDFCLWAECCRTLTGGDAVYLQGEAAVWNSYASSSLPNIRDVHGIQLPNPPKIIFFLGKDLSRELYACMLDIQNPESPTIYASGHQQFLRNRLALSETFKTPATGLLWKKNIAAVLQIFEIESCPVFSTQTWPRNDIGLSNDPNLGAFLLLHSWIIDPTTRPTGAEQVFPIEFPCNHFLRRRVFGLGLHHVSLGRRRLCELLGAPDEVRSRYEDPDPFEFGRYLKFNETQDEALSLDLKGPQSALEKAYNDCPRCTPKEVGWFEGVKSKFKKAFFSQKRIQFSTMNFLESASAGQDAPFLRSKGSAAPLADADGGDVGTDGGSDVGTDGGSDVETDGGGDDSLELDFDAKGDPIRMIGHRADQAPMHRFPRAHKPDAIVVPRNWRDHRLVFPRDPDFDDYHTAPAFEDTVEAERSRRDAETGLLLKGPASLSLRDNGFRILPNFAIPTCLKRCPGHEQRLICQGYRPRNWLEFRDKKIDGTQEVVGLEFFAHDHKDNIRRNLKGLVKAKDKVDIHLVLDPWLSEEPVSEVQVSVDFDSLIWVTHNPTLAHSIHINTVPEPHKSPSIAKKTKVPVYLLEPFMGLDEDGNEIEQRQVEKDLADVPNFEIGRLNGPGGSTVVVAACFPRSVRISAGRRTFWDRKVHEGDLNVFWNDVLNPAIQNSTTPAAHGGLHLNPDQAQWTKVKHRALQPNDWSMVVEEMRRIVSAPFLSEDALNAHTFNKTR